MSISIKGLNKSFGNLQIYKDFNMNFKENHISCILGKSGCGKSTLLNLITETIERDSGEIKGIKKGSISYVFQEDRLIEWKTVYDNLELVLKSKVERANRKGIIEKILKTFNLQEKGNCYPKSLSGGMRQRVSIARALIYPSELLIMDEPFKSLDIKSKNNVICNLRDILKLTKKTVIFVTHDIDEAISLSDYIYVLGNSPVEILKKIENHSKLDKNTIKEDIVKELNIK